MKAVIKQEWRLCRNGIITCTVLLFMFNLTALITQHSIGDILGVSRAADERPLFFALTIMLKVCTGLITGAAGTLWGLYYFYTGLRRQMKDNTRCLLLTIPRSAFCIFGSHFLFYFAVQIFFTAQAVGYFALQIASLLHLNSGFPYYEILWFGLRSFIVPNLPFIGYAAACAAVLFAFLFAVLQLLAIGGGFSNKKLPVVLTDVFFAVYCGVVAAVWQDLSGVAYVLPGSLALVLLMLHGFGSPRLMIGMTKLFAALFLIGELPAHAAKIFSGGRNLLPVDCGLYVPFASVKEKFLPVSADFLLRVFRKNDIVDEETVLALPIAPLLLVLLFAAVYFFLANWIFNRHLEE